MKIYVSVGISTLFLLEYYHCYENLCRRNSTTVLQSSTYKNQEETLATDGDLRTNYRYCAHTDVNQTVAWFQVDLGKPHSISNVTLYYRKDGLGNNEWQPYRFRQFYLDVSDLPASQKTTAHRTRCYTDSTTHPDVLPHIINIPCKHTARYVIVETTYDAPEDNPTTGAILEICEIEVYGCETGEYGDDCKPCSECKTCDVNNGICGDSMVSIECTGENNLPGMLFTTYDQDNDENNYCNCGAIYGGGWWFNWCHIAHLHGPWASSEWSYPWYPSVTPGTYIQETLMMVKPN